jgi:hypothetical protein
MLFTGFCYTTKTAHRLTWHVRRLYFYSIIVQALNSSEPISFGPQIDSLTALNLRAP